MSLKGLKVEVHVCKLLTIFDNINGKVPEEVVFKLMAVSFKSSVDAFKLRDSMLLRHIIEFFLDMWKQGAHQEALLRYTDYDSEIEKLLNVSYSLWN